jgi:hypothetical protein
VCVPSFGLGHGAAAEQHASVIEQLFSPLSPLQSVVNTVTGLKANARKWFEFSSNKNQTREHGVCGGCGWVVCARERVCVHTCIQGRHAMPSSCRWLACQCTEH